jgi:hypothetical protein
MSTDTNGTASWVSTSSLGIVGGGGGTTGIVGNPNCAVVDTGDLSAADVGVGWTGYKTMDLTKDGLNLCETQAGCTTYFWSYDATSPAGNALFNDRPNAFRQVNVAGAHKWTFDYSYRKGTNGDATQTTIAAVGSGTLYDDRSGTETSADSLTFYDNSASSAYMVAMCMNGATTEIVGGGSTLPTCAEGQTLKYQSGSWVCKDIDSFYAVGEVYFGGMYGEPSLSYSNPLAGNTKSCPAGYKAYQLLGHTNVDYNLFFCAGDPNKVSKVAEFGGVYSSQYNNPLTGAKSCPSGYISKQVLGTINVDNGLHFCYKTDLSNPVIRAFGGMYGAEYFNPLTGGSGCFIQYDNSVVFGQGNVDYAVGICHTQ